MSLFTQSVGECFAVIPFGADSTSTYSGDYVRFFNTTGAFSQFSTPAGIETNTGASSILTTGLSNFPMLNTIRLVSLSVQITYTAPLLTASGAINVATYQDPYVGGSIVSREQVD